MRNIILIADPSENNRAAFKNAFEGSFVIVEAEDEKQAIKLMSELGKKMCAVIADYSLRDNGALSVLKFMEATGEVGKFPVIFMTPFNFDDEDVKEYADEIDDIIEKPFSIDIAERRVRNLVDLYNYRRSKLSE